MSESSRRPPRTRRDACSIDGASAATLSPRNTPDALVDFHAGRDDLKIFLPPIGGMTAYIWGDASKIEDEDVELTVRVHDECNGSDVFGSDICTCRPYLTHAIEECIKTAQRGGTGVVVYFRKEGRALGEVTKYLVYNMRKRQEGGDKAKEYECGVIRHRRDSSAFP